jgi:NADPH-dependent glutamate synthase beta subunit-like oxidoreductase
MIRRHAARLWTGCALPRCVGSRGWASSAATQPVDGPEPTRAAAAAPLRFCVVGSGPAGFYTADKLLKLADSAATVDLVVRTHPLAEGRCLAGCVCAQMRAAGRRAARGGGTAHTRAARLSQALPSHQTLSEVPVSVHLPLGRLLARRALSASLRSPLSNSGVCWVQDRLPTPFGLVRSGVAPDHPDTKAVTNRFTQILAHPRCR